MHYSYIIYTSETKNIENKTIKTALPMMITLTYTDEKFIGIDKRKKKRNFQVCIAALQVSIFSPRQKLVVKISCSCMLSWMLMHDKQKKKISSSFIIFSVQFVFSYLLKIIQNHFLLSHSYDSVTVPLRDNLDRSVVSAQRQPFNCGVCSRKKSSL